VVERFTIRVLPNHEFGRIGEIDRAEYVTAIYQVVDGTLQVEAVQMDIPPWSGTGDGPHSVGGLIQCWQPVLEESGLLLGAFAGDQLAAFAMLRHRLTPTMAQLALFFVSRPFRRQGAGSRLLHEVEHYARAGGATELYVSATPSASAIGFYTRHGFRLNPQPDEELFRLEPEDIHMVKLL
jgi:GNAT superfamily N-acetyltransferase